MHHAAGGGFIFGAQVISHNFGSKVAAGFYHNLNRLPRALAPWPRL
jgi:hypothetical protein